MSNSFEYGSPIIYELRSGNSSDPYKPFTNTPYKVIQNSVLLSELPVKSNKVQVRDGALNVPYYEVIDKAPLEFEYVVDYVTGIVKFNPAAEGRTLHFSGFSKGNVYFPADRVWTKRDNGNVTETLKEVIAAGESTIENIEMLSESITGIAKVFITGNTYGMSKDDSKDLNISYRSHKLNFDGIVNIKWQGSSSIGYPKKNFTIKLYTDPNKNKKLEKSFKGWGKQSKFCLKANYIDHSHSRNIVSANLWGEIANSRVSIPEPMKSAPNLGAIDGFPIKLYINNKYEGLYTWNIPKDGWLLGMESNNLHHAFVAAETQDGACAFRENTQLNGSDWSLEFPDVLSAEILQSLNAAINHVKDTDDVTFKANFTKHFDLESALDYYIFAYFTCGIDTLAMNHIMVTYDGQRWHSSMYDLDSTWGLWWDGTSFVSPLRKCPEEYQSSISLLWERLVKHFYIELYERYSHLRKNVLSVSNIINKFEMFTDKIPEYLRKEDVTIYNGIPSVDTNNIAQIRNFVNERSAYVDSKFKSMVKTKTFNHSFTNLLSSGEQFNTEEVWLKSDVNVETNVDIGLFGEKTADRLTSSVAYQAIFQRAAVKPDTDYCFSFYVRNNGTAEVKYSVYDFTNEGNIVDSTSYKSYINAESYTRIIVPFHTPVGCNKVNLYPLRDLGVIGADIFIWGAMLNYGLEPLEYERG
ncbi:CotH kinase family protein [Cohnella herbarum]|uniref:Spore coat protein CotH n=1 Tax=Cohnella herbarum TaxID=2728023 RepID=A0A7Z2ZLF8_9BACL|nr:CotH kinase family protein [Cohnella herbarum]QJD83993.1 hypothetical protein HH215_12905 [Cohnella herbarum]